MEIHYKCKDEHKSLIIDEYQQIKLSSGESISAVLRESAIEQKGVLMDLYRYLRFSNLMGETKEEEKFKQEFKEENGEKWQGEDYDREEFLDAFYNSEKFNLVFPYQGKLKESRKYKAEPYISFKTKTLGGILYLILRRRKIKDGPEYNDLIGILIAFKESKLWKDPFIDKSYAEIMASPIEPSQNPNDFIRSLGINIDEEVISPERRLVEVNMIRRDKKLSSGLKVLYEFTCQLCQTRLELKENEYYCEVHHIRPLGSPHDGPDEMYNMIVVCPNCHVLLDNRAIKIHKDKLGLKTPHIIDDKYIDYHNKGLD